MRSLPPAARRAGWNVIDQVLSALGNVLLMVLVAREVDEESFGAFAIGFLVYGIAMAICKAVVGQPLQIKHSTEDLPRFRITTGIGLGAAFWCGVVIGVVTASAAVIIGGVIGASLFAVAICLPGLLIQDTYRMAFVAHGHAHHAALINFVKTLAQFAFLIAALMAGMKEIGILTLTWGLAATLSAIVGGMVLRSAPQLGHAPRWFRQHRGLMKYLVAEYTLGLGAAQLGALLVPILGTTSDAGAIRAGQTIYGPLNILVTAALTFLVPEVSRLAHGAFPAQRIRIMGLVSGVVGIASTGFAIALLLVPQPLGEAMFGKTWDETNRVLLPLGLLAIAAALGTGPGGTLLGLGLARKTFRFNMVKCPLLFTLLIPMTLVAGAPGAAWAMAITETVLLPFWTLAAWRAIHGHYDHLLVDSIPPQRIELPDREPAHRR